MPRLNQGDALIVPNVLAVRIDDQAEHAVDERHGGAVRGAEQEAAAARAGLRAGADDREVDRNHRQHAGRQVQRQPADQHEQEDRQRSASLEHPFLLDAVLGVVDEGEKVGGAEIAERRSLQRETVERSHLVGRHRGSAGGGRQDGHRGGGAPPVSAARRCPNAIVLKTSACCFGPAAFATVRAHVDRSSRRGVARDFVARLIAERRRQVRRCPGATVGANVQARRRSRSRRSNTRSG